MKTVGINSFVLRQTKTNFDGTRITKEQLKDVACHCNTNSIKWKKGYAPFCFIIPLHNVWDIKFPLLKITKNNEGLLKTKYVTRRKGELPYLTRYFSINCVKNKTASIINVIVYSKQHLLAEKEPVSGKDFDIISINAEMGFEIPMSPETIIRNHLGINFGGSGYKIDKKKYLEAVKFWSKWAFVG